MSRCTSERLPGASADSRGTGGAGSGVHDDSSAAGEWSSSALTASFTADGAEAQEVLSRRPGLAPLAARCRALPLNLWVPAFPRGVRSLPPTAVARRAQANRTVAMTTKPSRLLPPPTPHTHTRATVCLELQALGALNLLRGGAGPAGAGRGRGAESPLGAFEEGQTTFQGAGPTGSSAPGGGRNPLARITWTR